MNLWPFKKTYKDPSLLIKELEDDDIKIKETAFHDLIEHDSPKTDGIIYGTLEAFSELPIQIVAPLIEIAARRKIDECLPIFKTCLLNDNQELCEAAFTALTLSQSQDNLDILIAGLSSKNVLLKMRIRNHIIEKYGRESLGALLRAIPEDKNSKLYFEIVSIMEDLDLFTLIKSNFKKPDPIVKKFYFDTLVKFNRTDFLPLYIDYYKTAELENREKIESILDDYTIPELLTAFKDASLKSFDGLGILFDKLILDKLEKGYDNKGEVIDFLSAMSDSPYRRRSLLELIEKIDVFSYARVLKLFNDSTPDIRVAAVKSLVDLIDNTWNRINQKGVSNADLIKKHYDNWEKQIVSIMRDPTSVPDEQFKYYRKLFFAFVKNKHSLVNGFIQDLFRNSFNETYRALCEWTFDEQADLYGWLIKSDSSFGALLISGITMNFSDDNMWRIALKVYYSFEEKEDADVYMKNLVSRHNSFLMDKYTKDSDPDIRSAAISFIATQLPGNYVDILKKGVSDISPKVRLESLKLLEQTRYSGINELYKEVLNDPDEEVAYFATVKLSTTVDDEEFASLTARFINSPFKKLREYASKRIVEVSKKKFKENFNLLTPELRKIAGKAIQKIDKEFDEQIIEDLNSYDPQTRLRAVQLLENLKVGEKAKTALISAMKDPSKQVRAAIVKTLGLMDDPTLIKYLIGFFNDPDSRVRANTIEAVASLGDRQVVKFLLPYIEDENNRIRGNAIVGIKKLGNYNVLPLLKKMLSEQDANMRATALWAMGEINDNDFLPHIYPFMGDANELVRFNAAKAISRINIQILSTYYFAQMRKDPSQKIRKLVEELSYKVI